VVVVVVARWWQTATTLDNEPTCSRSRVVMVGDGRLCWRVMVMVAENKVCKQNTVNKKYAGTPLHPLSLCSVSTL
jgi:hypothetical protein